MKPRDIVLKAIQHPPPPPHNRAFVLMPGCDIPAAVPLENIMAFIRTGLNWTE